MMIKRGDRVKFLNDTGGGVVTGIKDSKMAMVLIDDGFEVPALISELLPVTGSSGYESGTERKKQSHGRPLGKNDEKALFSDKPEARTERDGEVDPNDREGRYGETDPDKFMDTDKEAYPEYEMDLDSESKSADPDYKETYYNGGTNADQYRSREIPARKAERNILLGLVESHSEKDNMEAWLINDSRFNVFYFVLIKDETSWRNIKSGHIEPDTKIFITHFSREQINSFITLRLHALYFMKGIFDPVSPSQTEFSLDPVEIYSKDAFTVNDFFDENAWIFPVISDTREREVQKVREQETGRIGTQKKDRPHSASLSGRKKEAPSGTDPFIEEVDLHIEELVDDHSSLSGREVLDLQMSRFTTALDGALRGKTKRIVFIHGIGNGKLKFEIRKTLDKKYPRLKYQDASFKEYGYGATMVIIRK